MFKSTFLKNAIIVIVILFGFQFLIFAQAINGDIEVKTENLPVVSIKEEIGTNITERQTIPVSSNSAQLYFTINSVNDFVDADIMVNSGKQSMNLVYAVVHYPSDKLMFNAISFENSAFSLFLKEINIEKGTVTILAIQPFPGIQGIARVAHLQFDPLVKGDVNLTWGDHSVVLANDGFGTNILDNVVNIYFHIE